MCKSINKNTKFNLSRKDIVDTPNAFSVPPKINNAPFLNNSRIWNISNKEHYSEWFLEEISRIKRNVIHYYHNGRMIQKNHSDMYSNEFYDKLCSNLVEETNIVEAIYLSNGYITRLDWNMQKDN